MHLLRLIFEILALLIKVFFCVYFPLTCHIVSIVLMIFPDIVPNAGKLGQNSPNPRLLSWSRYWLQKHRGVYHGGRLFKSFNEKLFLGVKELLY